MYKSQVFTMPQLQQIVIPKEVQNQILEYHKTPLDFVKGFETLKKDSENFTKPDVIVQQTDVLFFDMVNKYLPSSDKQKPPQSKGLSREAIRIRAQRQKRELELLALELELQTQLKSA